MDYWIHPNPGTRIKEELLKLNVTVPKHDLGLFMYQCTGSLHGILVTHVDDFFIENFIKPLNKILKISSVKILA